VGDHVIKDLLTHFDTLYVEKWGFKYLFSGKDAKLMKDLLAVYSADDIKAFLAAFCASHDEFIQGTGFSLSAFRGCLPKVIASVAAKPKERVTWECPHLEHCAHRAMCEVKMHNPQKYPLRHLKAV
jgi:hypothetical protein